MAFSTTRRRSTTRSASSALRPFGNQLNITNPVGGLTNPYLNFPGGNPFPQAFPPPKDVAFPAAGVWINLPRNIKPTYLQQWNLSWQRQVIGQLAVHRQLPGQQDVRIIGSALSSTRRCSIAGATTGNTNSRRVLSLIDPVRGAPYATIGQADDGSNASYNGMLLSIQHRFANHFTNLTNYTWSHCINEGRCEWRSDRTAVPGSRPTGARTAATAATTGGTCSTTRWWRPARTSSPGASSGSRATGSSPES